MDYFPPFPSFPNHILCCLSLPICCLNTMLLKAHQPWSISCYRWEVKRFFQLLSYWLGPPSGQARPSVNPAHNERRSLPTEKVSLWVYYASFYTNSTNRRCKEIVCLTTCAHNYVNVRACASLSAFEHFYSWKHLTHNLSPFSVIYLNIICIQLDPNFWNHIWHFVQQSRTGPLPAS